MAQRKARLEERRDQLLAAKAECLARMTEGVRRAFEEKVAPALRRGEHPPILHDVWEADYRCKPVSIREFIFKDYFLGKSLATSIYPKIVEDLEELYAGNYVEAILAGSQAWGKTRMANIGILYDVYRVSCLRDPAATFGQIPGSTLAFVNLSVRSEQANRVFFNGLYSLIRKSPYFNEEFPFRKNLRNEIQFCRGAEIVVRCYPVAANEESVLGEFIFSAAIDEVNFMDVVEHSKRLRYGDGQLFSQAIEVYNRISVRIRGRLNQRGNLPGLVWIISSARSLNDFTERKEQEALHDKQIFVRHYAQWETKPRSSFTCNPDGSLKTFKVEVGTLARRSRIVRGDESDVNLASVIEVPVDLRPAFEKDLERALRDLAGRSTLSINPFIMRSEMIRKIFIQGAEAGLKHPLNRVDAEGRPLDVTLQEPTTQAVQLVPENLHWVQQQKRDTMDRPVFDPANGIPVMEKILFPALYYGHGDYSQSRDATGLCVGHVIGTKKVERFDDKTYKTVTEDKPIIRIDLIARIVPPRNGEIDIPRVRGLLYQLRDQCGMQFGKVTFDRFGSQESVKTMKDAGFSCEVFSVDADLTAYEALKEAIYDERIQCYAMPKLEEELAKLEWTGTKVDHPSTPGSSKDLADCLAAVVQHCEDGWRSGRGSVGLFKFGSDDRLHAVQAIEYEDELFGPYGKWLKGL